MSLVNDSLNLHWVIRKYAEIFYWKNVSSFCSAKATHIFSAKNIRILYIESAKTGNEMTLNELVKLTTLWTIGPRCITVFFPCRCATCSSFSAGAHFLFDFAVATKQNGHWSWQHILGRQPPNDHNCQTWFTSLQVLWRKCNLTIFPL